MVETDNTEDLPEFTVLNVLKDIYNGIHSLIFDPLCNKIVIPIIITVGSIISKIVPSLVPYTEIDYITYMQQIEVINNGELDYDLIYGDSGPIVYPAGHVQIYQILYYFTNGGEYINTAQKLFGYLFTISLLMVLVIYSMAPGIPPWTLYLLISSKRLISIYVLRLFNDCFTTWCMIGVTLLLQQASYWYSSSSTISFWLAILAADLYSIAISIKMNALLYFPAFLVVLYFLMGENVLKFCLALLVIPIVQLLVGWKFILPLYNDEEAIAIRNNYFSQAFNFKRKFLFKWSVNWNFLGEDIFSSDLFAKALLALHFVVLIVFFCTRYTNSKITKKLLIQLIKDFFKPYLTISPRNSFINYKTGPKLILLIMSTCNLIGVLFSRSLHYQFLSWYCWQLPFLIYMTNWNIVIGLGIWIIHEYCWNVYPPNTISSGLLVTLNSVVLLGVWTNKSAWLDPESDDELQAKKQE
ncbi:uncharacterized protein PRCAT00003293001 [Priceomyces carsonii]|uniref:uncharacterized protein n=1 Tax=Priceomyces carsonii TaxID=28549 RepID=UPI002EDB1FD6|nr:unnamed protein product [Priceomyces carsonii]